MGQQLNVLALTKYSRLGASSRLRCLQFIPQLALHGISIDHSPLLSDEYLKKYYAGEASQIFTDFVSPMLSRVMKMLSAQKYDVVWLEKEALPFVPWLFEFIASSRLPPVVVDYDDAIFHNYDLNKRSLVRNLLGQKIDRVMASANVVMAGNEYLAARAESAGARNIEIIPTVLDPQRYQVAMCEANDTFRIGWIGTKSTTTYLQQIAPALARAQKELKAEIVLIGADTVDLPGVTPTFVGWTEDTEAAEIGKLTLGIMPLTDTPWSRGKCGYKLLQYMASGLPVVASPVGANNEIVTEAETGYLAADNDAWFEAFAKLKANSHLAREMGKAGRLRVEQTYSIDAVLPKIENCLRSAAKTMNS